MRRNRDLRLVVAIALACALCALILPFAPLRLLFAAPLALLLPGYALTAAIFARRRIETGKRLVLSVGMSLAVLALGALPLNYLPGGIGAGWWVLLLVGVTVASCRSAALRRPSPGTAARSARRGPALRGPELAALAVGAIAAVGAVVLIFVPLDAPNAVGYTALWMQLSGRSTVPAARVGVANAEHDPAQYTIELRVGGRDKPFETRVVSLAPGREEVFRVNVPYRGGRPSKVSATLFKQGLIRPYRRASVWIPEGETRG